jgi:hypothetical protein
MQMVPYVRSRPPPEGSGAQSRCGKHFDQDDRNSVAEMSEVRLKTPIDQTFTRAKSGVVWGRIYFEIDCGQFFPNSEWTDMVVAFELAWLRALLVFAEKRSSSESVRFYDGPFTVNLSANDLGSIELSLIHKEIARTVLKVTIESLLQNAVLVAEQLLSSCSGRDWSNADTEALATLLEGARRRLRSQL